MLSDIALFIFRYFMVAFNAFALGFSFLALNSPWFLLVHEKKSRLFFVGIFKICNFDRCDKVFNLSGMCFKFVYLISIFFFYLLFLEIYIKFFVFDVHDGFYLTRFCIFYKYFTKSYKVPNRNI